MGEGGGVAVGEGIGVSVGVSVGQRCGGWQRPAAGDERNRQGERDDKEQRHSLRFSTHTVTFDRLVCPNHVHLATLLSGGVMVKDGGTA